MSLCLYLVHRASVETAREMRGNFFYQYKSGSGPDIKLNGIREQGDFLFGPFLPQNMRLFKNLYNQLVLFVLKTFLQKNMRELSR